MNILIKNCTIVPMSAAITEPIKYFKGSIAISDGIIIFTSAINSGSQNYINDIGLPSDAESFASDAQCLAFEQEHEGDITVIDATGKVAMPGLINLHNHVSMSLMRGYADDIPLMPWLYDYIWPFEAKLTGEDIYLGAKLGIAEMLLGGTTTFADMYWKAQKVAQAVDEMGIRAVIAKPLTDQIYDTFERETIELIEKYEGKMGSMIKIRIAPHAPYTCSPETITKALKICERYNIGVHTHMSESRQEVATIKEIYGKTPTEYYRDLGVFNYPTLAAHCVHMTDSDIKTLLQYGVSVSHNPQSNMKISSGIAPVTEMLKRGINVGIGTDGPGSNNDLDMWEEMRSASFLQKVATEDACAIPAYQLLQMATINGARALGMEGKLGVLKNGARADIILIDTAKAHLTPCNDLIANLAYCAKASDVDTVLVDGQLLVENGKLTASSLSNICSDAQRCVDDIAKR